MVLVQRNGQRRIGDHSGGHRFNNVSPILHGQKIQHMISNKQLIVVSINEGRASSNNCRSSLHTFNYSGPSINRMNFIMMSFPSKKSPQHIKCLLIICYSIYLFHQYREFPSDRLKSLCNSFNVLLQVVKSRINCSCHQCKRKKKKEFWPRVDRSAYQLLEFGFNLGKSSLHLMSRVPK